MYFYFRKKGNLPSQEENGRLVTGRPRVDLDSMNRDGVVANNLCVFPPDKSILDGRRLRLHPRSVSD